MAGLDAAALMRAATSDTVLGLLYLAHIRKWKGTRFMVSDVISKPIYQIISELTHESRLDVALPLAIKDWVRLRLKDVISEREVYEQRYGMSFTKFQQDWEAGQIANAHSYVVEQDYWEWEAAVTDEERLLSIMDTLP